MRQLCLVLVLVAASFLGGAFVNGPGLRWVQTQLLGSLGLSEGGEIVAGHARPNPVSQAVLRRNHRPHRHLRHGHHR